MRLFVTGGSGFAGQHFVRFAKAKGHDLVALTRSDAAEAVVRTVGALPVRGDLDDQAAMRAGMAGCDAVCHFAAKVGVWGARADFQRATIDGTRHVLDAARVAGVPRFIHVSTEAVLVGGPKMVNADETWPLPTHPLGLYPWSKGRAEDLVRAANRDGLATCIVRPRFVWGPDDTTLATNMAAMARAGRFAWVGGGRHKSSTCHARNLAAAMLLCAERAKGGEIFFVTDGEPVELRSFVTRYVKALTGQDLGDKVLPLWAAKAAAASAEAVWTVLRLKSEPPVVRTAVRLIGEEVTVSDAKIRRELGYAPVVTIASGLAELGG